jgi:DNA-binding transcriptional MerR regulator
VVPTKPDAQSHLAPETGLVVDSTASAAFTGGGVHNDQRQVPRLRIGVVAATCGLPPATIRSWEQRHGVPRPARSRGGQRLYSTVDVEQIQTMRQLIASGWSVSAAAQEAVETGNRPTRSLPPPAEPRQAFPDLSDDRPAMEAVLAATTDLLSMTSADDGPTILAALVHRLGGEIVAPEEAAPADRIPVDVSIGVGPPRIVRAPSLTIARMRLETVLPAIVECVRRQTELVALSPQMVDPDSSSQAATTG